MKSRRFVVASDLHDAWQDQRTVEALFDFIEVFNPRERVFNGDLWDFAAIRKGASQTDESVSLDTAWTAGREFAKRFYKGAAIRHFNTGNHEMRLWERTSSPNAVVRDHANRCIEDFDGLMSSLGCSVLPFDPETGIYQIGKLNVVHGYCHGEASGKNHAISYDNVLYGDSHKIEVTPIKRPKPAEARCIGCLCVRNIPYIRTKIGKLLWGNGWAYGIVRSDGTYDVFQARKVDGKFTVATEFLRL